MTQDEIIEMARRAGLSGHYYTNSDEPLERFAKLVAAKEREWWKEHIKKDIDAAKKEEREACADLIHELAFSPAMFATMDEWRGYKNGVSAYLDAIRARGEA